MNDCVLTQTTRHGILEGRRALDRALLPLVPYPKRPCAFFVSFLTYTKAAFLLLKISIDVHDLPINRLHHKI
jgi:hypothetical protein